MKSRIFVREFIGESCSKLVDADVRLLEFNSHIVSQPWNVFLSWHNANLRSETHLTLLVALRCFGPLCLLIHKSNSKHYVHCLVMGLARPAMAGMDRGAYEKLRSIYNNLDIRGPPIVGAEDMEIANLCKHPFCKYVRPCFARLTACFL